MEQDIVCGEFLASLARKHQKYLTKTSVKDVCSRGKSYKTKQYRYMGDLFQPKQILRKNIRESFQKQVIAFRTCNNKAAIN